MITQEGKIGKKTSEKKIRWGLTVTEQAIIKTEASQSS